MRLVQAGQAFSFNYTAYDQDAALFIAFSVYDVTTGTASFLQKIVASYSAFGAYMADFTPLASKTYLIIGAVYTDNTYTAVDTSRSPSSEVYQSIQSSVVNFGYAYATYDQATALDLEASIYDMTSGTPVFLHTASMAEVAFGVYYGSFSGQSGKTYQAIQVVYTDNSFTTPDLTRAPACDELDGLAFSSALVVSGAANLIGQQLRATLQGQAV